MTKYWETLLLEWRAQGHDGLTIPFIIGSQKYLLSHHNYQEIEDLLADIATSDGSEIYLTYCMNLNEIILGVRDSSKRAIAGNFPPFEMQNQTKLFLTKSLDNLGNDVESIALALKEKFQSYIDNANFSKDFEEWGDYSGKEKAFIKDCFESQSLIPKQPI
jgi:hypothetical protein